MSKQLEAGFLFHRQPINELEAEDCFTGRDICWFDRVKIVIVTNSCTGNSGVTTSPMGIMLIQCIN